MDAELAQHGVSTSRRSASSSRSLREPDASLQTIASTSAADANVKAEDAMDADEEDEDEQADNSGESSKSALSRARAKKAGVARNRKGRRGSAAARARSSKISRSAEPGALANHDADDGAEHGANSSASVDVRRSVLSEGADIKDEDEAMAAGEDEYGSDGEHRKTRRRSASGLKELAGLGLSSLGDGSDEPLQPRRSRRSAISPNQDQAGLKGSASQDREDDMDVDGEPASRQGSSGLPAANALPSGSVGIAAEDGAEKENDIIAPEDEGGEEGVTRCLCGSADENVGLMIQCETCKCWQHCICMGMRTEEDCPDVYFCEQCRPELHLPLLRLLGVFQGPRSNKKGSKSRNPVRDASKELREAKEAVLTLAKENERRRKEGRDVITGWSVAQRQEQEAKGYVDDISDSETLAGPSTLDAANMTRPSSGKRSVAIDNERLSRSASRDELPHPKSPPKRRSTMNSRESVFGWEPLPPGLLAEGEVWEEREDKSRGRRRRGGTRDGMRDDELEQHTSTEGGDSTDMLPRVRQQSQEPVAADDGDSIKGDEDMEEPVASSSSQPPRRSQLNTKKGKESERPKHPNQYTKRAAMAAAAAANGERSSPSPSPNKRNLEGTRRSMREVNTTSRMGTPSPGDATGKSSHTGQGWGLPEHLTHLSYLLPSTLGPDALKVDQPTTKGSSSRNTVASSRDPDTDRITRASPQPYSIVHLVEAATKIRYPGKRMTVGEAKRRTRQLSEQLTHAQIDRADRQRRLQALGLERNDKNELVAIGHKDAINATSATVASDEAAAAGAEKAEQEEQLADKALAEATGEMPAETKEEVAAIAADAEMTEVEDADGHPDVQAEEATEPIAAIEAPAAGTETQVQTDDRANELQAAIERATAAGMPLPFKDLLNCTAAELFDELAREIINFQQRFGQIGGGNGTGNSSGSAAANTTSSSNGNVAVNGAHTGA